MSNQDESAPYSKLPTYQFFSADLNYNYYTDSTVGTEAPPVVAPSAVAIVPVPAKVEYSLTDDEPDPTFEERVAAMATTPTATSPVNTTSPVTTPIPTPIPTPTSTSLVTTSASTSLAITPVSTSLAATPVSTWLEATPTPISQMQEVEEKWNQYPQPSCAPINFSSEFNFNRSLLKIFWRIDVDHNNRVSKSELATALSENWFSGDEELLAQQLYDVYEQISPETVLCDAGLSVNNILNFAPFCGMSRQTLAPVSMTSPPNYDVRSGSQSKPKAKKLRTLFQKR